MSSSTVTWYLPIQNTFPTKLDPPVPDPDPEEPPSPPLSDFGMRENFFILTFCFFCLPKTTERSSDHTHNSTWDF